MWLLMACFCVLFSGAIKKVLQLRADQKISMLIHCDNEGVRPISQNIKDGCREKHEVQALVASDNKQFPAPAFIPTFHLALLQASPEEIRLYAGISSCISYTHQQATAPGSVPVYLLSRKLQV
jgi:hypothetical protein